ncbi:probable cation-transporting ATPase 13A4 [Rhinatrema bivittatum]|uniref:probable cation-transporting ATPase 13A4 n=1 Tax=Rhinatrema bivittatum TaxID=194408 RepID=UPI0011273FB0|nr:probable cation-transporting ATPase 13A4 [Rhinatrema bivittatum]
MPMGENLKEPCHGLLNQGEENEMEIFGYRTENCRRALCILGYIFSFGFLLLLFYWKPDWNVRANCVPCSLEEADVVLLIATDEFHQCSRKKVTWIFLRALNNSFSDHPDQLIVSDENSIINKAILRPELKVRCIKVQKIRYVWNNSEKQFQKVGALEDSLSCSAIHSTYGSGFTSEEQQLRRLICGPNTIEVEVVPIWKLLFKEVLNPFYVFQLFSVCLWFAEDYKEYAIAIIIMSVISIALTIYDLRQQSVKLHKLVESHNNIMATVCRKNEGCSKVESCHLVPGDILVLLGNTLLPCDAVLLSGGCIVNESMLTGESIPVTKTPLPCEDSSMPWKKHSAEDFRRHVLFCGTEVIQTKPSGHSPVKAIVLQTGFNTAKGDLVRSILYPKPMNFRLYRDALRFLMCLIGAAAIGMIYAVCVFSISGESAGEVVKKALDVITIAVPPALPAALTIGIIYAQKRLEKKAIFCISPQRINMCGMLNLICFDKTGTLTEDGLDLWGIVPSEKTCFQQVHKFSSDNALPFGPLLGAMTSCHSLIVLDGKIQGDPLDLKMFEGTDWEIDFVSSEENDEVTTTQAMIVKPGPNSSKVPAEGIAILHQFPFSSALQRMSVIAQVIGEDHLTVYMKGAPEMVTSFCRPDTVPFNFSNELQLYTRQGFRVIGFAYKSLGIKTHAEIVHLKREEVESNLIFIGLLIMENRLKVETKPVLQELCSARIRTVMITGDNLQTAVTVAKNSSMVSEESKVILVEACEEEGGTSASITWRLIEDCKHLKLDTSITVEDISSPEKGKDEYHFAMNGQSYHVIVQHFSNLLPKLLLNGTVFARMSPGQKSSLVEEFQKLDYFVGMCGDGANDCGALKVAHAGISLSEQEASVASPFTSKTPNIECVPQLIKEGRAALVTSFCVFKYMALYSMIQYLGILLLYWQLNSFGNYQFLFQDLAITTVIGITMSLNHAYPKLASYRPPGQLISPPLLLSVVLNILFSLIMQVCGFLLVQQQPWYSNSDIYSACNPVNKSLLNTSLGENGTENATLENSGYKSYENTTVWLLSTINCILVAFVFSKGKPFRQPVYTNYIFVLSLAVQLGICIFFIFADIQNLYKSMDLVCTPIRWRGFIVLALFVILVVSFIVEEAIIENRALWILLKKCFHFQSKSCYKKLQRELEKDIDWPPTDKTAYSLPAGIPAIGEIASYSNPAYENEEKGS